MTTDPTPPIESNAAPEEVANTALRILVIDDEAAIGVGCQRVLEPEGHEVQAFSAPEAGLQAALSGDFDIILLDLSMPGLDGFEILRQIKQSSVPSEVIIITGDATVNRPSRR
jgi:DNA-binding response OmpR family regulator